MTNKCEYPGCKEDAEYAPREDWHLCQEHYALYRFIDSLLWSSRFVLDLSKSRFSGEKVK